jgi:hypothetical protein
MFRAMRRMGGLSVILLLLAGACSTNGGTGASVSPLSSPTAASPASTPSPSPPPEPKTVKLARVEGVYDLRFTLISSNLPDSPERDTATWRFKPTCKTGGGCMLTVRSVSGWYDARAAFVKGRYRFARRVPKDFYCQSNGEILYYMTGVREYTLKVVAMKLLKGEWIATRLEGVNEEHGTRGCGFTGTLAQRYAVSAVRRFR